nr:helix-turn-helix domain-containing protein [uncultured Roseburia sp.]
MAKPKRTVTEYRSYYLPTQFPVLLLSGDYWKISDIPSGSLHFHNCLEIGLCHSDSGTLEINGEKHTFRADDITVLPRNVPHTTYSTPGTKSHWSYLFLDPKEMFRNLLPASWTNYDLAIDAFPSFRYIFSRTDFPHIHYLVSYIIHELEVQNPCYQISVRSLLSSLYIELYRIESLGGVNPDSVKPDSAELDTLNERKKEGEIAENSLVISPALDYIEENYMQQFTIEYLADLCHWSPTHFRRVFHDIMGTSPLDYVNNTRILKSCILLRSTEHSILDISEMVGFRSVSSFNRYFIKLMQLPPREYRKQMKQSEKKAENQSILEFAGWMRPE